MKKTKVLFIIFSLLFILILLNLSTSYAIMFDLEISGNSYVEIGKSIQLKSDYITHNDSYIPDVSTRETGREDVTSKTIWTSSDSSIATISNTGLVTGIKPGTVTITANYAFGLNYSDEYSLTIVEPQSEHQWTDVSNIKFTILRENDNFHNYKIKASDFTAKDSSEYYMIVTNSASDKPIITTNSSGLFETDHNAFLLDTTNYIFNDNINDYIEKNGDIYVWFYEYTYVNNAKQLKELVSGQKVERPVDLPLGHRLNGFFFSTDTTIFNYTILSDTPRIVSVKIGPVTDINILKNIKNNQPGALTDLLNYAKSATNPIFEQYLPLGDSGTITNVLNISDKSYYYVYMELDNELDNYYPLEDVSLYQGTVSDTVGKNLFNYLYSDEFDWDLAEEPVTPDDNNNSIPQTPNNNDNTIAQGDLPNTGKVVLVVAFVVTIILGVITYLNIRKYKEIK